MKHRLRLFGFTLLLTALLSSGTARAQTEDLKNCESNDYTQFVNDLLIEIPVSDGLPPVFDLTIGRDGTPPIKVKKRKSDDPDTWGGQASKKNFRHLNSYDLQPNIPGFTVSGPESCRYQPIQAPGGKRCAAKYEFSVRSMKVLLKTEPPKATIRLKADADPRFDKDCVPPLSPDRIDEARLLDNVRAALNADSSLHPFVIDVAVQGGEIYLSGLVNNIGASTNAEAKARNAARPRVVKNTLHVSDAFYGGLLEVGKSVTIVQEKPEGVFAATLDVPADFFATGKWTVSKKDLQEALHSVATAAAAKWSAANKDPQHDGNVKLLQKALGETGDLNSITIRRGEW